MADEFLDVGGGVKRYQAWYNSTSNKDTLVQGTGVALTDTQAMQTAAAALENQGGGTLWLEGEIVLDAMIDFTTPVSIRGVDDRAHLKVINRDTQVTGFRYNGTWRPTQATRYPISPAAPGDTTITSVGAPLVRGELFVVMADNDVPNALAHSLAGSYYAMELHRANDASGSEYYFDDFLSDPYTTNPQLAIVPSLKNIVIADLQVSWEGTPIDPGDTFTTSWLQMLCGDGVTIENVRFLSDGPGAINLNFCSNVVIQGLRVDGQAGRASWYGVSIGCCNQVRIADSFFNGTRHAFTTGNGDVGAGEIRYGGPRNVTVSNCTARATTDLAQGNSSHVVWDTHVEGYQTRFVDCEAVVASASGLQNYAFQSRARETSFEGCRVRGPVNTKGFRLYGHKNQVVGCTVDDASGGAGSGVEILDERGNFFGEHTIERCRFNHVFLPILHTGGDQISIYNNTFSDVIGTKAIQLTSDGTTTGHKIHGNVIDKGANLNSIDSGGVTVGQVEIANNTLLGYGSGDMGLTGTHASTLNSSWATRNHVDL